MKLSVCCTLLFLLFSSKVETEILSSNWNSNIFECLNTLIGVTDWEVNNFLVISGDMFSAVDDLLRQHPNFGWKIYSARTRNLTEFFNVILFAKDFHDLNETLSAINIKRIDSRSKFIISITTSFANLDEIKKASKGISSVMWNLDKTRVIYLVPSDEGIFAMTYFPFVKNCQPGELEFLDIWNEKDFEKGTELFPEKMSDIHGCVQNHTGSFDESLHYQLSINFTETGVEILDGIGGRLITIVAEKMNMALKFVEQNDWDLLTDQIIRGESLFSVAGNIPTATRVEFLDMDSAYMEERFTFCYISGGSEVLWKNIVHPLSKETWAGVGCTFVLFFGLLVLASERDRWVVGSEKFTMFDSFGIFLGSSRLLPRSNFGRYLTGMWIVYSYLINAFYNSGSVSLLALNNEPRVIINTLEELLVTGIDFGGAPYQREFYHDSSDPVMMKIYDHFKNWSDEESLRIVLSGNGVSNYFSSAVYYYNRFYVGNDNNQMRMLKENALTFHAPIFMRKGSPFALIVHRYTTRIIESGFVEYWGKCYTSTSTFKRNSNETVPGISTRHLQGIFYLYIAGIISSSVVLLLELIFFKEVSIAV